MNRLTALMVGGLVILLVALGCAAPPPPTPTAAPKKADVSTPKPAAPAATAAPAAPAAPTAAPAAPTATSAPKPTAAPAAKPAPASVKVGTLGAASDSPIFIAMEKGYFQEEGLDIKLEQFGNLSLMMTGVSTGDIDVGTGSLSVATLNAIDRGVYLKLVGDRSSISEKFMYASVLVRKDLIDSGQVKTIKDLKGRKIGASSLQSTVEAEIAFVLDQGGLTVKDVELVQLGYPETIAAMANKAIDAGFLIEPNQTMAVERGIASLWEPGFFHRYTGGSAPGASMTYSEKMMKNVEVSRRFMVSYVKGVRDYIDAFAKGKGKAEIVPILIKNTNLKDAALYDRIRMTYINPNGAVDIKSNKMVLDYLKKMGYYAGKLEIEQMVDNQFADYAVQRLGKYE